MNTFFKLKKKLKRRLRLLYYKIIKTLDIVNLIKIYEICITNIFFDYL